MTIDGEYKAYVVPAFASSSLAPVVTNDLNRLVGMAEAIDQVIDTCKTIIHPGNHGNTFDSIIGGNGNDGGRIGGLAGDY